MKKLKYLILSLLMIVLVFPLTACDKNPPSEKFKFSQVSEESINTAMTDKMNYFYDNIYNSNLLTENMTYNFGQIEIMFDEFDPYVELGTITNGTFSKLSFGNRVYNTSDEKAIKIGSICEIKDKVLILDDNKVYVNVLVLYIESHNSSALKINDQPCTLKNNNTEELPFSYFSFFENSENTLSMLDETAYHLCLVSDENLGFHYFAMLNDRVTMIKTYGDNSFDYLISKSIYNQNMACIYIEVPFEQPENDYNVTLDMAINLYSKITSTFTISNEPLEELE